MTLISGLLFESLTIANARDAKQSGGLFWNPRVRDGTRSGGKAAFVPILLRKLARLENKSWFHYVECICLRQTHDSTNRELNHAELRLERPTGSFSRCFASRACCSSSRLTLQKKDTLQCPLSVARDGTRTRDPLLGKEVLHH